MRSLVPARLNGRTASALLIAGALVVSAGVGGATAGAMLTGRDIKDKSITGADIKDRSLDKSQLSTDTITSLRTSWNSGAGAPKADDGDTNSWYLDTATGDAYKNTPSGWQFRVNIMGATGAPGAVGPKGADGVTGATGATGAKGDQGVKGDTGSTGAKGDKGDQGDIGLTGAQGDQGVKGDPGVKGDAGTAGAQWLQGTTAPAAGTGALGDWYLDTTTWDAYEKGAGGWVVVVNLRGPIGPKGDKGDTGAAGAQGATGQTGATGQIGAAGQTGATGPQGPQGPQGATGSQGPKGDTGAQGLQGPAGAGGLVLKDGNGVTLGKVVTIATTSVTFVTSNGYLVTTRWSGLTALGQIYYTDACGAPGNQTGEAYLNDGSGGGNPLFGKAAVFSGGKGSWMVPSTVNQGYATSGSFTSASLDNPACGANAGQRNGWLLRAVTPAELGIPAPAGAANQFALPLSVS